VTTCEASASTTVRQTRCAPGCRQHPGRRELRRYGDPHAARHLVERGDAPTDSMSPVNIAFQENVRPDGLHPAHQAGQVTSAGMDHGTPAGPRMRGATSTSNRSTSRARHAAACSAGPPRAAGTAVRGAQLPKHLGEVALGRDDTSAPAAVSASTRAGWASRATSVVQTQTGPWSRSSTAGGRRGPQSPVEHDPHEGPRPVDLPDGQRRVVHDQGLEPTAIASTSARSRCTRRLASGHVSAFSHRHARPPDNRGWSRSSG